MNELLEPLTLIAGIRLAAMISEDGVPISLQLGASCSGTDQDEAFADFQAFAAIAAGWRSDLQRSIGPLSWEAPQRLLLTGTRGAVVMCACPGAMLLVVLEHGVSPSEVKVPMDGVVARMERKLRSMGSARAASTSPPPSADHSHTAPAQSGPDVADPQSLLPSREQPMGIPNPPQSPSPQQ